MVTKQELLSHCDGYIVCYASKCPLHSHCLRWQMGQLETTSQRLLTVVNPHHAENANKRCVYYRSDQPVSIAFGMLHFFREMPHYKELAIKHDIMAYFTRTRYYRMRRAEIPISPDDQQVIADICRRHDWTVAPVYDRYEEQILW